MIEKKSWVKATDGHWRIISTKWREVFCTMFLCHTLLGLVSIDSVKVMLLNAWNENTGVYYKGSQLKYTHQNIKNCDTVKYMTFSNILK